MAACLLAMPVWAQQVDVGGAWVRGTVVGQAASAAYMELRASENASLIGVASPVAGLVEVHEMSMDNGVMKMRPRPRLDLPAGKTIFFKEGSYHVMLMELKRPLRKGEQVPLTLKIEGKDGKVSMLEVKAEVRDPTAPRESPAMEHMDHSSHMGHMGNTQ